MSTSALPFGPDGVRTPVETSDLDLRYYSGVLWRGRWLVVVAMVLGVALSSLVAYLQVPEYQARSLVQIEPPVPFFMGVNEALMGGGGYWQNTDFYNTQFKIITSKAIADRVIDELKLKDKPPFSEMKDASGLFLSHISVEPVLESRLVYILVSHEDPEEAALWANQVADVYIRHSLDQRVESARKAFDWLRERLQTTEAQMKEQNDRLYRQYQEQDFVPSGTTSAVNSSIEKLQGELVDVQSKRIALDAAYRQALDLKSRKQSLESVPQIAQDSSWVGLQAQVTAMELERQRLKEKYRDSHPEMVRIDTLIKGVRQKKDERAAEVIVLMEKERAQLQKREAELRSATEEQKSVAAGQNRRVAELDTIKKQASSASGMYDVLLQKLNESNIATSVQTNNIALVDKAVGGVKVKPNQRQAALTGLAIGLLLGIGLVLGRDYFDNTIKDPDEVERYLHLDLLAVVPKYDESNVHLVTEAYQNLRTALIFARREDSGQVVLITGTAPQEGKTSTIVNLAKLLAASGEKDAGDGPRSAPRSGAPASGRAQGAGVQRLFHQARGARPPRSAHQIAESFRLDRGGSASESAGVDRTQADGRSARSAAAALRLDSGRFTAARFRHRRFVAGALLRSCGVRGAAQQDRQEGDQAKHRGPAESDAQSAWRRHQRPGHQDARVLLLLLPPGPQGHGRSAPAGQGHPCPEGRTRREGVALRRGLAWRPSSFRRRRRPSVSGRPS
jgi:succinoglycan biosynthesis transport protein ExoP